MIGNAVPSYMTKYVKLIKCKGRSKKLLELESLILENKNSEIELIIQYDPKGNVRDIDFGKKRD